MGKLEYKQHRGTLRFGLSVSAAADFLVELLQAGRPKIFPAHYDVAVVFDDLIIKDRWVKIVNLKSEYNKFKDSVKKPQTL